jgi:hypothetical protein
MDVDFIQVYKIKVIRQYNIKYYKNRHSFMYYNQSTATKNIRVIRVISEQFERSDQKHPCNPCNQ